MISAGSPRSVSNRVNASNGDDVSTPPKSQITASIIYFPAHAILERANTVDWPGPALGDWELASYFCPMKILAPMIAVSALLLSAPAYAIVGGGVPSAEGIGRSVVTIVGSRGNFCSGALIAPKLVLTVAHGVQPGATYKIVEYGAGGQPQLHDVKDVAIHPSFNMQATIAHRATADVALLQLEASPKGKNASLLGVPQAPMVAGSRFTIAGIGVTIRGEGSSGGAICVGRLGAARRPGSL